MVTLSRLKRRRNPFVKRIGRLNIVMCVAECGGLARSIEPVSIDQGVTLGGNSLNVLQPNPSQLFGHKFSGLPHVGGVLLQSADTGNA